MLEPALRRRWDLNVNMAVIFAGGTGRRMSSRATPKQFLELHGKAIIIYTLEHFQRNVHIDAIVVVCLGDWIDHLEALLRRFEVAKVRHIVPGGASGLESIHRGLRAALSLCDDPHETTVLIHDGVRPLITDELITANIDAVAEFGSAVTIAQQTETVVCVDSDGDTVAVIDRNVARIARAPQSFRLADVLEVYDRAADEGFANSVDSASLMMQSGRRLHTVEGPLENIKITTPLDYFVFRSVLQARESSQILGYEN